jgi:type II secretory pathway pseudopilin PulG
VLAVVGVLLAVTVPSAAQLLDTATVLVARQEATALLALARGHARAAGRATAVSVRGAEARLVVHAGTDTLRAASWRALGVTLDATRDSLAYGPDGLGVGAANLRLILRRGGAADTLSVSRLGRVRAGG